jgi:hypothetical protein
MRKLGCLGRYMKAISYPRGKCTPMLDVMMTAKLLFGTIYVLHPLPLGPKGRGLSAYLEQAHSLFPTPILRTSSKLQGPQQDGATPGFHLG